MAEPFTYSAPVVDPSTGFSAKTQTFHSLRPPVPLPPSTLPLSFSSFALSLLPSPPPSSPALIDASTGSSLSYPDFISQLHSLSYSLKTQLSLSKGNVAFILSPSRLDIPILYFSLLSIGVAVSPANPLSSPSEVSRLISLVKPSIIFATSATSSKLPPNSNIKSVFLDSFEFRSLLTDRQSTFSTSDLQIHQSDTAAIQFSSGTTGRIKGAELSHRSFIAMVAGFHALRTRESGEVALLVAPMFHSLGFFFALKGIALGETVVVMSRVGFRDILSAAERYRVTLMTAAPPVVVAMSRAEEVAEYDLGALETVLSGGAPLSVEVGERFMKRFPRVELRQVMVMVFFRYTS